MGNDSELSIVVRARNEASRIMKEVANDAKGVGGQIQKSFKDAVPASAAMGAAVVAAGAAVVGFGVSSVKAFMEAQDASAQLDAVLKSTGGAAGVTKDQLLDQATALQSVTKFSDEAVQATQAMLLTFTNLKGGVMQQATQSALDMAQALGMDGAQAALQLGKALNDPAAGLTKLQRVGVTFTDQQKKQVEAMVEAGNTAGAQKVILQELNKEFGGSATKAGATYSGQLEILKNTFGDLQEAVGQFLLDAAKPLIGWFSGMVKEINNAGGIMAWLGQKFEENKQVIFIVAGAIGAALVPALIAGAAAAIAFIAPLIPFIAVGAAIGAIVYALSEKMGGLNNLLSAVGDALTAVWNVIGPILIPAFQALWNTIATQLWPALQNLWNTLAPVLLPVLQALGIIIGAVIVAAVWIFINVLNIVIQVIVAVINFIAGLVKAIGDFIGAAAKVGAQVGQFFADAWNAIVAAFGMIGSWFSQQWQKVVLVFSIVGSYFGQQFRAAWNAITSVFAGVGGFFRGVWNTITSIFGNIGQAIGNAVSGAVKGAINGALTIAQNAVNGFIDLINGAINLINKIPGVSIGKIGRISFPRLATGTDNWRGGWATVGEQGRENVWLPPGAKVMSQKDSDAMAGGVTNNFNGPMTFATAEAVDRFYDRINNDAQRAAQGLPI